MSRTWQVQTAKARFSEFLEASLRDGPQVVTKRGVETAVLVPIDQVAADGEHHETEPEGSIARTRGAQRLTHFRTRRPSASRHGPCWTRSVFLLDTNVVSELRRARPSLRRPSVD